MASDQMAASSLAVLTRLPVAIWICTVETCLFSERRLCMVIRALEEEEETALSIVDVSFGGKKGSFAAALSQISELRLCCCEHGSGQSSWPILSGFCRGDLEDYFGYQANPLVLIGWH
ncbi:hypothetical protein [Teichococcus aestuarii]|uniref:hypothetical protein n=1 Tax=Teichococcus aestuarii TaxID=568898 RepID=UPI00361DBB25